MKPGSLNKLVVLHSGRNIRHLLYQFLFLPQLLPPRLPIYGFRCEVLSWWVRGTLQLKCDVTRAETRFCLSTKRTSPFISAGASVQSTTGSRGVRISGSNTGYTMFRGSVKSLGYPLHSPVSPSFPLPCVTVCHHISTGLYSCRLYSHREGKLLRCVNYTPRRCNCFKIKLQELCTCAVSFTLRLLYPGGKIAYDTNWAGIRTELKANFNVLTKRKVSDCQESKPGYMCPLNWRV